MSNIIHIEAAPATLSEPMLPALSTLPPDRHPAFVYLASLRPSGRRSMTGQLRKVADLLSLGACDVESFPWSSLRYQHMTALRSMLIEQGLKPASVNVALSAVSSVLRESWRLGLISAEDYHRARDVKRVKASTLPSGRALKVDEVRRLLGACRNSQQRAMLALMVCAGLRRAEVAGLNLDDYRPGDAELRVNGKGGKQRLVPLETGTQRELDRWLRDRGDHPGPLFQPVTKSGKVDREAGPLTTTAIYRTLRRVTQSARVERLSPHDLRRTFITELLDRGADVFTVSKLAGHSSADTTRRYDRRDQRAARDAIALLNLPA